MPDVTEPMPGPSQAPTVLDIGGDVGAAVVHTPSSLEGVELEIRPLGAEWDGTHVAVRARGPGGGPPYAALFGQLRAGVYELRRRRADAGGSEHLVQVRGAEVSETHWPDELADRDHHQGAGGAADHDGAGEDAAGHGHAANPGGAAGHGHPHG